MSGRCLNSILWKMNIRSRECVFNIHHHFLGILNGIYNLELNEEIPRGYFSVGIHPKDISGKWENDLNFVKEKSQSENCLAIGECGLDALVNVEESLQEKIFLEQILWANEIQKPVIIHCVRRFSSLLKFKKDAKIPLIIHGFNKKKTVAEELLERGFYLSFGKSLLHNIGLQEVVRDIPLDKIFLETDVWEGDVEEVCSKLSDIKQMDLDELKNQISETTKQVFKIKIN